ncbi:unnamed protein product, partial [Mesorhabditis belari]|uniref:Copper transport protein ATOX1 n=1 Tax=Mesorhabditis belari TaxID=2138241 RepID=A0AAF3FSR2_9BILA
MTTLVFEMEMTCEGCANAARKVLGKLGDKVHVENIDVKTKLITLKSSIPATEVQEALEKTGKKDHTH